MRSIWSCSSCAVLLLFALLGRDASASHVGRQWKDVHRIAKAQVTAHPARRDEGSCPAEHSSCAASLGGDCCPSRYACAVDSCYATTAGPTTACGKAGFFACGPVNGGAGCCPVNYICGDGEGCYPPVGITYTAAQCPTDYFLCPASANYGCCRSGLVCGADLSCYSTEPVTATLLQTITTTSGSETVTETRTAVTVSTPAPPTGAAGNVGVAAKFIPTSVPKVAASSPSNESSGGLSGGAIGGIIAGVVVLLIVVVVAAFLIIRRLKRVEDIMESKRGSSSGRKSKTQSHAQQMEHYGRQLHSDVDDMQSVDPLMIAGTTNNNSTSATPQPGSDGARGRANSANGFTPSPNMMFNFTDDRSRHASPDSNAGGYFDIPPRAQNLPGSLQAARIRGSTDDTGTGAQQHRGYAYTHWRQQSNASELSADGSENGANVGSPLVGGGGAAAGGRISELHGSGAYVELPGGGGGGGGEGHGLEYPVGGYLPGGPGGAVGAGVRSRSSSAASATRGGHVRRRSDGVQGLGMVQGQDVPGLGLAPLDEAAEMHGYYGRPDQQAGQTAAGLDLMGDGVMGGFHQPEGPQGPPGSPPVRGA